MSRDTEWEVLVVGAGHAGCEAALAAARLGCRTLLLSLSLDTCAQMSCNPCIGGSAKGILTREIDALGGIQGLLADRSGVQFRMLNRGRGAAVQSPRAQCDRALYSRLMRDCLERTPNLALKREEAEELLVESMSADRDAPRRYAERLSRLRDGAAGADLPPPSPPGTLRVAGVRCAGGREYFASAVILTTGTFLSGLLHQGTRTWRGGRLNEPAAMGLSLSLAALGLELARLKTGTPPRLDGRTVRKDQLETQWGDEPPPPFSFRTARLDRPKLPCWSTRTTRATHDLIRANLHQAPLFTGQIRATGPRYCPSVETKIVRFPEKESHQVFLEPEGVDTDELYANGLATSLPAEVQLGMVRSLPGCEAAEVTRFGYAIEYDMLPPHQIDSRYAAHRLPALFLAGQINGTSGYEEAAGQGLMAGINAALAVRNQSPFVLGRHEAYLGVMSDDLATKELTEPYRLFTSRAEHRLLLRQDNADRRLFPHARRLGLLDAPVLEAFAAKEAQIAAGIEFLRAHRPPGEPKTWWNLLRQPAVALADLRARGLDLETAPAVAEALEIEAKYEGYLARQMEQVRRLLELESRALPHDLDYSRVPSLAREAREKLARHRPRTFGQALRVEGVTPADVSLLAVFLEMRERERSGACAGTAAPHRR